MKLEENSMGEFGWKEVLKQFLDEERAKKLAVGWDGDDYATYERKDAKSLLLFTRIAFRRRTGRRAFSAQYSEALKKKYPRRTNTAIQRRPDYSRSIPSGGGVFLRCAGKRMHHAGRWRRTQYSRNG